MPHQCTKIEAGINNCQYHTTDIVHVIEQGTRDNQRVVISPISTATNSKIQIRITNTSPNPFTLKKNTSVADFHILSVQEAKQLRPLNSAALNVLADDDSE